MSVSTVQTCRLTGLALDRAVEKCTMPHDFLFGGGLSEQQIRDCDFVPPVILRKLRAFFGMTTAKPPKADPTARTAEPRPAALDESP